MITIRKATVTPNGVDLELSDGATVSLGVMDIGGKTSVHFHLSGIQYPPEAKPCYEIAEQMGNQFSVWYKPKEKL